MSSLGIVPPSSHRYNHQIHSQLTSLVEPLPDTGLPPSLPPNTANAHTLAPSLHLPHLQLLLDRQNFLTVVQHEHFLAASRLHGLVPGFGLDLCCALPCSNTGVGVKMGGEVFEHDGVVHQNLFVPTGLLRVVCGREGTNMRGY